VTQPSALHTLLAQGKTTPNSTNIDPDSRQYQWKLNQIDETKFRKKIRGEQPHYELLVSDITAENRNKTCRNMIERMKQKSTFKGI
jgi:hypothetical protein